VTVETKIMDVKKTQQAPAPAVKEAPIKKANVFDFIGNVKEEFSKITWTNPEELRAYTKMVVGATFIFGMGIYFVDLSIRSVLNLLGFVFQLVFG
jgi:preprotein translocase subunit SecE